jgi:hypothetical protein
MPRNINSRLGHLRTRRRGLDRLARLAEDARLDVLAKSLQDERWQTRATTQPYTRYALGAMEEVGPEYTRISIDTAKRVGNQLDRSISDIEFRIQGSVPLNVHIRGVSDVDLLTIDTRLLIYDGAGDGAATGRYSPSPLTSTGVLADLRANVEQTLPNSFPACTVDTTGAKAVTVSGGSLPRQVDVVPSHWYDTLDYQRTHLETDRGVIIYNKKTSETIKNYPFKHIALIEQRDSEALGGLKKAIRLCKNVKADAEEEGTPIAFPSFDIAATMYHADRQAFIIGYLYELKILAEAQRHLDFLYHNPAFAASLRVPDGSRNIFDTTDKYEGMKRLSTELDDLLREVAKEQNPYLNFKTVASPLQASRDALSSLRIN